MQNCGSSRGFGYIYIYIDDFINEGEALEMWRIRKGKGNLVIRYNSKRVDQSR